MFLIPSSVTPAECAMRVDLFGLTMEAPGATVYLWSPWRCSQLEHKLFDALKGLPGAKYESEPDEIRLHVTETKAWKSVLERTTRVLKGWQEEASDTGTGKRGWRWLVEADTDANGFDFKGEKTAFWLFCRLSIDRTGPGDGGEDKYEDIDLEGFGVCVWGQEG
jgi:hypothetical protein